MSGTSQTGTDAHDTSGAISEASNFAAQYSDSFEALYIDQADTDSDATQTETDADGPQNGSLNPTQVATGDSLPIVSIFEPNALAVTPYEQGTSPALANNDDQTDVEGGPGGNPPGLSLSLGYQTGLNAISSATEINQPTGSAIYIALDFDTGPPGYFTDNQQDVQAFLEGISEAFAADGNPYKIGVYGSAQTLEWAVSSASGTDSQGEAFSYTPNVGYTWLSGSTGWAGYNTITGPNGDATTHGWSIIQSSSSSTQDGVAVDVDTTAGDDIGAWTTSGEDVACYMTGTRILTGRGEVAVEELQVGDRVVTFTGFGSTLKPIRWLGHRRIDLRRHPDPANTHPVRFRAGALGEGCPHRDLLVSPNHRMQVDGTLVTAIELANGASILQETPDRAEYWHIELDRHDLVLAEGVQAETYQDTGNRRAFQNAAVASLDASLDGDVPEPCLPYAGPSAEVRARLIARAEALGFTRSIDPLPWLEMDGRRVDGVRSDERWRFNLPAGYQALRLRSHAGRPCDVDPHSGDRRRLGLKLHRLALSCQGRMVEVPLSSPLLAVGFHPVEEDETGWTWRWTNGDAPLPLAELAQPHAATALEIAFEQALPMWIMPATTCVAVEAEAEAEAVAVGRAG